MIKKIRLLLDYGCYPVWLYDYKNRIVNTILPDELRNDIALDNKFSLLQEQYNNLFINTSTEFKFIGFKTKKDKENFIEDWDNAVTELKK